MSGRYFRAFAREQEVLQPGRIFAKKLCTLHSFQRIWLVIRHIHAFSRAEGEEGIRVEEKIALSSSYTFHWRFLPIE